MPTHLAVPETTKSFAKFKQPIRSVAAMNGSFGSGESGDDKPAITGSIKYGPNLRQRQDVSDLILLSQVSFA